MPRRPIVHDYLSDFLGDERFARAADRDSPHLGEPEWPWLSAGFVLCTVFVLWLVFDRSVV
jgi:hypothetical protein